MKEHMSEQPYSGNSAEKRSINGFQPILFRAVFHDVVKHLESSLDQLSAMPDIVMLTGINLTHRRVDYISWHAEELTEQIHRFTNMAMNEANGCRLVVQP
jgi:hypothetical protein